MSATSIRWGILQLIFAVIGLGLSAPGALAEVCPSGIELDVITLINQERQSAGLQPVAMDVRLVEASRLHSEDMAANNYFSHTGLNGSTFSQRVLDAGYPAPRSENIAAGYSTAASVVEGWMNSPGHRANILDSSAKHVGVGWAFEANSGYGTYWTNNFGVSQGPPVSCGSTGGGGGTNPPPPGDTTPPVLTVSGVVNGSTVSASVSVMANATDDVGVLGVQFLLDGAPLGAEDLAPPYQIVFDTTLVADGIHALSARARDAAGNQTTSLPVGVVVSNAAVGDPRDRGETPNPDPLPATGQGSIVLTIEPALAGYRMIRAESDAGGVDRLELYIDGQLRSTVQGAALEFNWDIRPLVGALEVRVLGLDTSGLDVMASTSLFYSVASTEVPSVSLDVVDLRIIGATFIRAIADLGDATRLELYVDRELVLVRDAGRDFEYAWDPQPGVRYELMFVVYNQTGVAASVSAIHVQ